MGIVEGGEKGRNGGKKNFLQFFKRQGGRNKKGGWERWVISLSKGGKRVYHV